LRSKTIPQQAVVLSCVFRFRGYLTQTSTGCLVFSKHHSVIFEVKRCESFCDFHAEREGNFSGAEESHCHKKGAFFIQIRPSTSRLLPLDVYKTSSFVYKTSVSNVLFKTSAVGTFAERMNPTKRVLMLCKTIPQSEC
jgi:hypothetical protein